MDAEFLKNLKEKLDGKNTNSEFEDKLKSFVSDQNKINEEAEKASKTLKDKYKSIADLENALEDARKKHEYEKLSKEDIEKANDLAQVQLAKIEIEDAQAKLDLAIEVYNELKKQFKEKYDKNVDDTEKI
ncbi:MAG: hypothetical protein ACOCVF_01360 [bacterium]